MLQATIGSPQPRYNFRHKRKDASVDERTSRPARRVSLPAVSRSMGQRLSRSPDTAVFFFCDTSRDVGVGGNTMGFKHFAFATRARRRLASSPSGRRGDR